MKRWLAIAGGAVLALLLVVVIVAFTPLVEPDLSAEPRPLNSYAEASERIEDIEKNEAVADIIPDAKSIALLTGSREETVVVIFHGYTSVPKQFRLVAQGYRDQGYNVWIPRLPYHGPTDRMSRDFSKIDPLTLRRFADENIDIAEGLGRNVVVVGFSGGGCIATWAGYERPGVTQTILISPVLHPLGIPEWADRPLVRGLDVLPFDIYKWWDAERKANDIEGYNYPRLSLKGLAAFLSMSHWVEKRAAESPSEKPWLLVRNDGDQRLDSDYNERYVKRVVEPETLDIFLIPAEAGLLHNFISPETFSEGYDKIAVSYDYLSECLCVPMPDPVASP